MDDNIIIIIICSFCLSCIFSIISSILTGIYTSSTPSTTKSPKNIKIIDCKKDFSQCKDCNTDNYIKIISGDIIKISNDNSNYYIYVAYNFFIDFIVDLTSKNININNLNDLLLAFKKVEQSFKEQNKCNNVDKNTRNKGEAPYNTICFFYTVQNIGDIANTINKVIIPEIPNSVINDYFDLLKNKINTINILTIFEYVMYIAINQYNTGVIYITNVKN